MAPWWLALPLPVVELVGAGLIARRFKASGYPAFLAYLLTEALWNLAGLYAYWIAALAGTPFRMALRAVALAEVFRLSRSTWTWPEIRRTTLYALVGIAGVTAAVWKESGLSPIESFLAFRQYYHVALAVALWALEIRSRRWPMLEAKRHRAYRLGMTAWMTVLAIGSSFVPGGLGYALWPADNGSPVWMDVRIAVCGCLTLTVAAMTVAMTAGPSKRSARIAGCSRRSNVVQMAA
jgi:hypothetical protein